MLSTFQADVNVESCEVEITSNFEPSNLDNYQSQGNAIIIKIPHESNILLQPNDSSELNYVYLPMIVNPMILKSNKKKLQFPQNMPKRSNSGNSTFWKKKKVQNILFPQNYVKTYYWMEMVCFDTNQKFKC